MWNRLEAKPQLSLQSREISSITLCKAVYGEQAIISALLRGMIIVRFFIVINKWYIVNNSYLCHYNIIQYVFSIWKI